MVLPPLAAETLFHLGSFPITNSLVNTIAASVGMILFSFIFSKSIRLIPARGQLMVESTLEMLLGYFDKVTGDRALSRKFFPFVGTAFFFVLISNWIGLLPGTGSIGIWEIHEGVRELIPLFRPANSDLNLTLALALSSVLVSHLVGVRSVGFFTHANRYIQLGTLWNAVKSLKPVAIGVALVEIIVGLIELIAELAKVMSLSLRLFGNVFAGEILTTVIASIALFGAPIPFIFLELLVGLIQALVFTMLTLVYFTLASRMPHGSNHDKKHEEIHELVGAPASGH